MLVMEDNPDVRLLLNDILQESGCVVLEAATASAAPRLLDSGIAVDAVLTYSSSVSTARNREVDAKVQGATLCLSARPQTPHEIVGSHIEGAPGAHVVEPVVAEQIQFADRGIPRCLILEPLEDLRKTEPVVDEEQLLENCTAEVVQYPADELIGLVLIDGGHGFLLLSYRRPLHRT